MKAVIQTEHADNRIVVLHSWNRISLLINGIEVATHKAIITFPFELHGRLTDETGIRDVKLKYSLRFAGATLSLFVGDELLAKKKVA